MPEIKQNPVIFVPGITASELQDEYPLSPETLWSAVLNKDYERLYLHPDNVNYDALEPALVRAGKVFELCYADMINSLRHELSPSHDVTIPVFAFPYDWRLDNVVTADRLRGFIQEVLVRSNLMAYYDGKCSKVDIVTHSMGSLVFAQYFSKYGTEKKIGKVATIAGPFKGSLEAIVRLTTGMGYLSGDQPDERERELARMGASLYQMLPSFTGAVVANQGLSGNLFQLGTWQPGLIETIQEYITQYALPSSNVQAKDILQVFLDKGSAFVDMINNKVKFEDTDLNPATNWLAIVGVGARTRVQIQINPASDGTPRFFITDDDFIDQWKTGPDKFNTGDTTVPLRGAIPPFLNEKSLVSVSPDDFGLFELKDKTLNAIIGLHAQLPNMDLVQRLVIRHLKPDYGGDVWGRPLPDVDPKDWVPPIEGLKAK